MMDSMAAWLSAPVELHSMRMFECGDMTPEQCEWYEHRWHFWYIADYVFALPTIAFFLGTIGIFIIGRIFSLLLGLRKQREPRILRKIVAVVRYASYRGFRIKALGWNSAPLGVLLLGAVGTIFFLCMGLAPKPYYWPDIIFGGSPPLATRSGWLALGCMPFIFATATKTNWITLVTGVSHERLQVFHRWISYAFFVLALLHTFPFIVYHIHWHDMEEHFASSLLFYWTGILALVLQAWLTFASHSTIRRLGYEFFKATHLFTAVIFIVTFFWHCDYTLTSWDYFIATAALYVPCYTYSWLRTCFEYGIKQKGTVTLEGGFIRVAIPSKNTSRWQPGQHCNLRLTGLGLRHAISSHPFTICSLPSMNADEPNEMVFYVRPYTGFTAKLYAQARDCPSAQISILVDGPYGGIDLQNFAKMDHILLVAGGSGAGWCLSFVEQFLRYRLRNEKPRDELEGISRAEKAVPANNATGPKQLRLALATRDTISRTWFLTAVESLLARYQSVDLTSNFRVEVFLTGTAAREADLGHKGQDGSSRHSASSLAADKTKVPTSRAHSTVPGRECEGRPELSLVVKEEVHYLQDGQSLGVYVCGPLTMQHDIRNAVAAENLDILRGSKASGVYLHSEHFSWA